MFNSPVLDLVILLSFTYFVSSLILSAITESIAGAFRLRQNDLRKALERMFFSAEWKTFVRSLLIKNPNIESLMRSKGRIPAYIPAQNFILAILSYLNPDKYKGGEIVSKTDEKIIPRIGEASKDILPKDLFDVLTTLMMQTSQSIAGPQYTPALTPQERFEKNLESFYNNTMDRVTGRYKKKIRKLLFITGFILAITLNIDTIKIANDALRDENKLGKTIDNITTEISRIKTIGDSIVIKDSANGIVFNTSMNTDTVNIKAQGDRLKKLTVYYEKASGYNLGYKTWDDFIKQWKDHFFLKILGILITVFALQLSSTFWFETINKAINIRAVGKNADENKAKASKP